MQVTISVRHGELSEATQEKIRGKVEKLLRFFARLTAIAVTVDLERDDQPVVELNVSAEHKHDFVSRHQAGEFWAALDGALDKMEQQIRRYKEKIQEHRPSAGPAPEAL